jgi:hypothetical protein
MAIRFGFLVGFGFFVVVRFHEKFGFVAFAIVVVAPRGAVESRPNPMKIDD